jgi:hypothetical protein
VSQRSLTARAVRTAVRQLLEASPAYAELPPGQQRALARQMTSVASYMIGGPNGDTIPATATVTAELVRDVDFPAFVSALVHGVFQAIVSASIQQMDAYGDLLKDATKAIDAYARDDTDDDDDDDKVKKARRRRVRANRQQLLATTVLMGINRIVVTDGVIKARVRFKVDPD